MSKFYRQPLMQYLAPMKSDILCVVLLSLIANLLMLAPTIYMLQLYDRVMQSKNELTLLSITLLIAVFIVAMAFAEWLRSSITIKAGVKFDQALNSKLFGVVFERISTSKHSYTHEAMQDLTNVRQFMTSNGLFAFLDMPWTFIYVVVLFILNPSLGWLAILFCMIQLSLAVWNQWSTEQPIKAVIEANQENQHFLASKVRNIESLHVMGILPRLYIRWVEKQQEANTLNNFALHVQNRNQLINKFLRYSMQSLMLAAAAWLAIKGHISIGSMIASNVLIARALQPFDMLVSTWKQSIQAKGSIQRLNKLLHSSSTRQSELSDLLKRNTSTQIIQGNLQFKDLSVTLANSRKNVLKTLSGDIHSGQILTIMGPSGAGKSTLIRCLVGVLPLTEGELLFDGISINQIHPELLTKSIGYLPQDVQLIEGTIAENIARFNHLDSAEIIAAAKMVGMHDVILRLPMGYDTKIDDAALSLSLSGGQKQLVGLARAIYKSPSILVLDEPNAHLDEVGETQLLNTLLTFKIMKKTIIVISHRANILKVTDQLLVIRNGEILHHGPKDLVLAKLGNQNTTQEQEAA